MFIHQLSPSGRRAQHRLPPGDREAIARSAGDPERRTEEGARLDRRERQPAVLRSPMGGKARGRSRCPRSVPGRSKRSRDRASPVDSVCGCAEPSGALGNLAAGAGRDGRMTRRQREVCVWRFTTCSSRKRSQVERRTWIFWRKPRVTAWRTCRFYWNVWRS